MVSLLIEIMSRVTGKRLERDRDRIPRLRIRVGADIVLISDGEDDEVRYIGPGSSHRLTAPPKRFAMLYHPSGGKI